MPFLLFALTQKKKHKKLEQTIVIFILKYKFVISSEFLRSFAELKLVSRSGIGNDNE